MFRRFTRTTFVVLALAVFVVPAAVMAGHRFDDVPDTNTFHDNITWLADTGITKGCNPPDNTLFCPDASVSRKQMSAFMQRFAAFLGAEDGTVDEADNAQMLAGAAPSAYTNEVFGKSLERDFVRSGLLGVGTTATITTVDYTAPADGYVSLDYYASFLYLATDTALIIKVSVDPSCSPDIDESSSYTTVDSVNRFGNAAGSIILPVSAGANTFALCGAYESGDANIVDAAINGTFSTTGTATVSATPDTSSTPLFP
jgi:hypothetical protein